MSPLTSHTIVQGAAAAGTFSSKGLIAGAYADGSETHKTTEEVEAYWMAQIENEKQMAGETGKTGLPWGFEQREKMRAAEAKAYGASDASGGSAGSQYGGATPGSTVSQTLNKAFSSDRHAAVAPTSSSSSPFVAEVALLRVSTHTLETLTNTLTAKPVPLDAEDRAAFAAAVKKSLDAVLHCRT